MNNELNINNQNKIINNNNNLKEKNNLEENNNIFENNNYGENFINQKIILKIDDSDEDEKLYYDENKIDNINDNDNKYIKKNIDNLIINDYIEHLNENNKIIIKNKNNNILEDFEETNTDSINYITNDLKDSDNYSFDINKSNFFTNDFIIKRYKKLEENYILKLNEKINNNKILDFKNFFKKKKHFLIMSEGGKPIYSRYGDAIEFSTIFATLSAIITKYICFLSTQDKPENLYYISNSNNTIYFKKKCKLYFIAIINNKDINISLIDNQLENLYNQLFSICTIYIIEKLEDNPSNCINILNNKEIFFEQIIKYTSNSFVSIFKSYQIFYFEENSIINKICELNRGVALACIILTDVEIIGLSFQNNIPLEPYDIILLQNYFLSSTDLETNENLSKICLPGISENGFLQIYSKFSDEGICICFITEKTENNLINEFKKQYDNIYNQLLSNNIINKICSILSNKYSLIFNDNKKVTKIENFSNNKKDNKNNDEKKDENKQNIEKFNNNIIVLDIKSDNQNNSNMNNIPEDIYLIDDIINKIEKINNENNKIKKINEQYKNFNNFDNRASFCLRKSITFDNENLHNINKKNYFEDIIYGVCFNIKYSQYFLINITHNFRYLLKEEKIIIKQYIKLYDKFKENENNQKNYFYFENWNNLTNSIYMNNNILLICSFNLFYDFDIIGIKMRDILKYIKKNESKFFIISK